MKVFVSSTYVDLKEYRLSAAQAIENAGMQPLLAENLMAGAEWNKEIRQRIETADIFLMIIGFRLGMKTEEHSVPWLQYEYEIAQKNKKPILVFMLDENANMRVGDIDDNIREVKDFRTHLMSNYLVGRFATTQELYLGILAALFQVKKNLETPGADAKAEQKTKENNYVEHKNVRILRLLISSPGDVVAERDLVSKAVSRFNQEFLIQKGVFIKVIRWEDMAPQIANGPQRVVNNQLEAFDIFIGGMWNRFGTPTDLAASGTEEEFNVALSSWEKTQRPWIAFYFCNRPSNFTTNEQLEQKSKVLAFKQKLMGLGLIKSYEFLEEFEHLIFYDLVKITEFYLNQTP